MRYIVCIMLVWIAAPLVGWNLGDQEISSASEWVPIQVASELSRYSDGVQLSKVKHSFEAITKAMHGDAAPIAHVHFSNGACTWDLPEKINPIFVKRMHIFGQAIELLHTHDPVPNTEFLLSLDHCCERPLYLHQLEVPIFCVSRSSRNDQVVLIPRGVFQKDREAFFEDIQSAQLPWDDRAQKLVWRLLTFERHDIHYDWRLGPTVPLFYLGDKNPDILDIGVPEKCLRSIHSQYRGAIANDQMKRLDLPPLDYLKYRYLLTFDQRSSPQTLEWQLFSGSVILKAETTGDAFKKVFAEWYSSKLQPYVHFVPIPGELRDIIDHVNWCINHDAECQQIAQNAADFAREMLTDVQVFKYFNQVLKEYTKLCQPK